MLDNARTLPAELRAMRAYRFDPTEFAGLTTPTVLVLGELSDEGRGRRHSSAGRHAS